MCNLNNKSIPAGGNTILSTKNLHKTNKESILHRLSLIYKYYTHLKV